jgi:predicted  nucleic acid-binding Zn-ribbon protein
MSIDSCDHGAYVVVYEVTNKTVCPVCESLEEKNELEQQITNAQSDIENLEDEIASLQNELG